MFEWPRFAAVLQSEGPEPAERLDQLLALLGAAIDSKSVLSAFFEDGSLNAQLAALAPRVHHVGFLAPAGLSVAQVVEQCRASGFSEEVRTFESEVWAREIANRFGRTVEVTIVQGFPDCSSPDYGVEVFVAELANAEIEALIAEEAGCHIALELEPGRSLDDARELLNEYGPREPIWTMHGPRANHAIRAQVLYVDVSASALVRRIEFLEVAE